MAHRRVRTEAGHYCKEENSVTKNEIKVREISVEVNDVFEAFSDSVVVIELLADGRAACRNTRTGKTIKIQVVRLQNEYQREGTIRALRAHKALLALDRKAQK